MDKHGSTDRDSECAISIVEVVSQREVVSSYLEFDIFISWIRHIVQISTVLLQLDANSILRNWRFFLISTLYVEEFRANFVQDPSNLLHAHVCCIYRRSL